MSDTNLVASNIASGVSIFGVTGTATTGGVVLPSNMHRDRTTTQISLTNETVTNAGTAYTNASPYGTATGYRAVPDINKDDESFSGSSVTKVTRTGPLAAASPTSCGTSGTIAARIANCASVIGAPATWDGTTNGNAGQGVWRLVTRTGAMAGSTTLRLGREVWQDQRTGLLWSSRISASLNWCRATGSNNISGNSTVQADAGICGHSSYQNTGGNALSACFEGTGFTQAGDAGGKGGLGSTSTPAVAWRLPTRYDYSVADANGIRFVLPEMVSGFTTVEWTATVASWDRTYAWMFWSETGALNPVGRTSSYNGADAIAVRCVGR